MWFRIKYLTKQGHLVPNIATWVMARSLLWMSPFTVIPVIITIISVKPVSPIVSAPGNMTLSGDIDRWRGFRNEAKQGQKTQALSAVARKFQ